MIGTWLLADSKDSFPSTELQQAKHPYLVGCCCKWRGRDIVYCTMETVAVRYRMSVVHSVLKKDSSDRKSNAGQPLKVSSIGFFKVIAHLGGRGEGGGRGGRVFLVQRRFQFISLLL